MTSANEFELWAARQLDGAGITADRGAASQSIRTSVLALAHTFGEMNFAISDPSGKAALRGQTLHLFATLAAGRALPTPDNHQWISARRQAASVGDTVRVSLEAFEGDSGVLLNGRVGRVVHVRNAIGVSFTDGLEPSNATFLPTQIDVMKRS